jgi:lipoprotein-anchoring transpeptidase ErfK/SrfK
MTPSVHLTRSRPARRFTRVLAAVAMCGALVAAVGVVPASAAPSAAAAPTGAAGQSLHVMATPRWAKAPQITMIIHTKLRRVNAYPYVAGKVPSDRYGVVVKLVNPTPQGFPLVMAGYGIERGFVLAELPVQSNNYFAWVKVKDVTITKTPYRIEISESQHRLLLWKNANVVGSWPVAVGKPSTPTPTGYFFINTIVHNAGPDYGNIIMSTSGFSNVYKTFGPTDGDAAVGIHGTDQESLIGQSVSHGCVRMHTVDATFLSHYITPGIQVVIQK